MRCLYINLDSAIRRRSRLEAEFRERAPVHWSLTRVEAVGPEEGAQADNALSPTAAACYLSHLRALRLALNERGDLMILEDDATFSARSFPIIDQLLAAPDTWDVMFTDLAFPGPQMFSHAARWPELIRTGKFQIEDLSTMPFAGSTAYLVRESAKQKLLDLLTVEEISRPIDLKLSELISTRKLSGKLCFPLLTSISVDADQSQVDDERRAVMQAGINAFRRLMYFERDLDACVAEGERLSALIGDEHARLSGLAVASLIAAVR